MLCIFVLAAIGLTLASAEMERDRKQYFDSLGGMALGDKRAYPSAYSFDSLGGMALGDKRSPSYTGALHFYHPGVRSYIERQLALKGSDSKRIVDSLAGDYLIKKKR